MRKIFWSTLVLAALLAPVLGYTKALNQVWRMGTSGNIPAWGPVNLASTNAITGQLARTNLPTVGQQISASTASFSTTSLSYVDVTNLTVTITTTGRPVYLSVIADGSQNCFIQASKAGVSIAGADFSFVRGASTIGEYLLQIEASVANNSTLVPGSSLSFLDPVAAGTYTYKVQAKSATNPATTVVVNRCKLLAFEL